MTPGEDRGQRGGERGSLEDQSVGTGDAQEEAGTPRQERGAPAVSSDPSPGRRCRPRQGRRRGEPVRRQGLDLRTPLLRSLLRPLTWTCHGSL